jgi:single-strand DNA-binding protein
MSSMNKAILMGHLTKDPELKFIPSGQAVANMTLAMNRKWKAPNGEWKEEVDFIKVVAWGKSAEACGEYLHKGSPILVEGRIHSSSWETADGVKKYAVDVQAERVQFLGGKKDGTGKSESAPASAPTDDGPGPDPSQAPGDTDITF